jgi:hypothetical protein
VWASQQGMRDEESECGVEWSGREEDEKGERTER